jgi:plastocyanin
MRLRAPAIASVLALVVISGLTTALPLANAQSTAVVSIPVGSGSGPGAAPGFKPENITVVIGVNNTVIWTNNDTTGAGVSHTVVPKSQPSGGNWPSAGSGNISPGKTYSFTFTVPGTYDYFCSYHSWMAGSVVVLASSLPKTSTTTSTTPEFPAAWLAVVLFAVIAAVMVAAPRLRPARMSSPPV